MRLAAYTGTFLLIVGLLPVSGIVLGLVFLTMLITSPVWVPIAVLKRLVRKR